VPLSEDYPRDPYVVVPPALRWYPGEQELALEEAAKLVPPLVAEIRVGVHEWRESGYLGVSETSQALLRHWFGHAHMLEQPDGTLREFRWYFAQREAIETAVWLFEREEARDPYTLMSYDASGRVSQGMFAEHWTRYVFKLATGAGKTKLLSLLVAWSYFHKRYEEGSTLSANFLLIAPNIIVLDRLLDDFGGARIFSGDPILPPNGYSGRNWRDDFQVSVHVQDEVGVVAPTGNLFVTNIHRVYEGAPPPSADDEDLTDFFLGKKPVAKTTDKTFDLGDIVRGIDDLLVLNDEAHHIHDEKLAWFQAIESIDAQMRRRTGHGIAAQFDVTATPRTSSGAIFVQTVCSYPLVEAIRQGVVKTPVVPDEASRSKLHEHASDKVAERYADHIKLGYLEWAKRGDDLRAAGKKPVLFVMTTTTKESDEVAEHLERTFPDLTDKVLVIHTNAKGEVAEKVGDKELEQLRQASRLIDSNDSQYVAVASVLMLREGWDVQNVISMVGLRPFTAKSEVLPEQTLGRGLRRMFRDDPELTEYVSVVGTDAFLDFVESVRSEGVELERTAMGEATSPKKPLLVEVDSADNAKDLEALDIPIPKLQARISRDLKNLDDLDPAELPRPALPIREFSEAEQREIVFKDLDTDETAWATDLGEEVVATPQAVIAFLTNELMRRLRLVGGREVIFGKLKTYIREYLFDRPVDLDDLNVLRNLSEIEARRSILENFAAGINALTVVDRGTTSLVNEIKLTAVRPVVVNDQEYVTSRKTVFNRVVGDSNLELRFAKFLDDADDVDAFAKNMRNVHFFIEYVNASGEIAHYYPDFVARTSPDEVYVVETKGLEDVDVAPKWNRLVQWCTDASDADAHGRSFTPLYVTEEDFEEIELYATTMARVAALLKDKKPIGVGSGAP
jgi:type III restriction enzyme